jgi:hypothetical protein
MAARAAAILVAVTLVAGPAAPAAVCYIHFPPMTLPKMCQISHHVRVLKVEKYDREKGVIVFGVAESLKGKKSEITSFRHVLRADAREARPILAWVKEGKNAVMFSIEGKGNTVLGVGYVFIDNYCYSVDYNSGGRYWLVIRGEPGMSACYHGPVGRLREAVKDILAGKEVKVPVKEPDAPVDGDQRRKEINEALKKNRQPT